ncbi:MFS transporter [Actinomadura rayongensis]|uniref:MFS transporter n=1 Tax=Actinomadura rayongensis TaxID=1429076 RepID=UPI001925E757
MLLTNPGFRLLWCARTCSFLGDALSLVALLLFVASGTGRALAVASLLLAAELAPALLGPLAGVVSDRFDLRKVMVGCELTQGAVMLVIAVWLPPLPVLLALVAVRAVAGQVFQPASRAVVPALVDDRDLERANALVGLGTNAGETLGPLVAAGLLPLLGVRGVLLLDVGTFLVSALLLAFLPAAPRRRLSDAGPFRAARAGLGHVRASPLLRAVVLGFVLVVLFNGIDDVALVFLVQDSLHGGDAVVAIVLAAVGIGLFVGYAVVARVPAGAALLAVGFAVSSLGNLLTGFAWAAGAVFAAQAARGAGLAGMDVAANTLIQRTVPADRLGRVFGTFHGGIGAAAALSYIGGGLLLDATSPRTAFIVAGTGGLAVTAATWAALRRAGRGDGARPGRPGDAEHE